VGVASERIGPMGDSWGVAVVLDWLAVRVAAWLFGGKADEGVTGSVQRMLIHSAGHPLAGFAGTRSALRWQEDCLRTQRHSAAPVVYGTWPAAGWPTE